MSTPSVLSIANSAVTPFFKTKYLRFLDSHYNKMHPFLGKVKRDTSVTGNTQTIQLQSGTLGGYSAGQWENAGHLTGAQATFTLKKLYFKGTIDSLSIKLSADKAGSAIKMAEKAMKETNREITRNLERQIVHGDGTGAIGTIASSSGVTDNGSGNYTITIADAEWVRDNWHTGILLQIGTSGTSIFRVDDQGVDKTNKQVTLTRLDGSDVPANSDPVYMQGGKNNEVEGIRGVIKATSGTKYGRTIGTGFQATQHNASSAPVTREMLLDVMYDLTHENGRGPDTMVIPMAQHKKLVHIGEAELMGVAYREARAGNMNIGNIPHIYLDGVHVPMMRALPMADSEIFMLSTDTESLCLYSAGTGEFEPGVSGFLHTAAQQGRDEYDFFWKKYCQLFVHPQFHAVIHTLSTTDALA